MNKKSKILKNVVEDRDIFVKISPMDSLETKKDLLEISEALIETQIAAEKFKQQRRNEMNKRHEAKKAAREIAQAIGRMLNEMPKEINVKELREEKPAVPKILKIRPQPQIEIIKPRKIEEVKPTKMADLQKELENIRTKISELK